MIMSLERTKVKYNTNCNGLLRPASTQPIATSPSPTTTSASLIGQTSSKHQANNVVTVLPSTSKAKTKNNIKKTIAGTKNLLSTTNFNTITPSADFKLPAEIFASDDSVSDAGVGTTEDLNTLHEVINGTDPVVSTSKDKMLGGINIKVEKVPESPKNNGKKTKKSKENMQNFNLADIKTELQDDFDWSNMTLATVHNNANINKFQSM